MDDMEAKSAEKRDYIMGSLLFMCLSILGSIAVFAFFRTITEWGALNAIIDKVSQAMLMIITGYFAVKIPNGAAPTAVPTTLVASEPDVAKTA